MSISPSKCTTFEIKKNKEDWYVTDPKINTKEGIRIQYLGPSGKLTYLGAKVSPWICVSAEDAIADLKLTLPHLKRLALKSHQKLELLSRHIIRHYLYPLTMAPTSQVALKH